MSSPTTACHGTHDQSKDSTWAHRWNTIAVSEFMSPGREQRGSATLFFFKHQYITNPTISPESHVVAAAQQLATALKGNIPTGNETAEALTKVSELFTKIAAAKHAAAAAKEQRNRLRANPAARVTTHLPRVDHLQGWTYHLQG